jgi:hypothetical protein
MEDDTRPELSSQSKANGFPAGKVFFSGIAGLALAVFINSSALLADAERLPDGRSRSLSVAVWTPIEAIASTLKLTWPRTATDFLLGRSEDKEHISLHREQMASASESETEERLVLSIEEEQFLEVHPDEDPTEILDSAWNSDNPFTIWVLGDSMVQFFGETFVMMAERSSSVSAIAEPKLASGLSRPDYFDWPTRISEVMAAHDPDAVILMFGGNDAQNIRTDDGRWLKRFGAQWEEEYRRRIAVVMDLAAANQERVVLWVGQPPMREEGFDSRMQQLNDLYRAEADERQGVHYLDLRSLFTDDSGNYARYLPNSSEKLVDVRLTDGVHLSHWGGEWLSKFLLNEIKKSPDLEELWNQ